jgi:hypothetical protein
LQAKKVKVRECRMRIEVVTPDDSEEKLNHIRERLEATRERMEVEALAFIEATKQFVSEWIQREIEMAVCSPESSAFPENLRFDNVKPDKSKLDPNELSLKVSDIVKIHLNRDDYWIHRNALIQPDISRDYMEFKKEKIRKQLISSIRLILGCATEVFWKLREEEPEQEGWVKERGKRKYVCFLRLSDEMTASLDRYLELCEEFFILNHEMKQEMLKVEGKNPDDKTFMHRS